MITNDKDAELARLRALLEVQSARVNEFSELLEQLFERLYALEIELKVRRRPHSEEDPPLR